MNQREALRETLALALERDYDAISFEIEGVDYPHLVSMMKRVDADFDTTAQSGFSEAKLGRWLGYAQGVLVATDTLTLEECKQINMKWADK